MSHHARGTFTVKMQPLSTAPTEGLMRLSIDKEIHGDLEATTKGEMLSAGDPKKGEAGYVAMEMGGSSSRVKRLTPTTMAWPESTARW